MRDRNLFIASIIATALVIVAIIFIFTPIRIVFMPFVTAVALCYFLNPAVNALERVKIKRVFGVLIVYAILLLSVILFVMFALPRLYTAAEELYKMCERFLANYNIRLDFLTIAKESFSRLYDMGMGTVRTLASALVGAAAAFYTTIDLKKLKNMTSELIPDNMKSSFLIVADDFKQSFDSFFKGQLLIAALLFLLEAVLLLIVRLPYAIVIAAIGGLLDIIPYVGAFLAICLMLLVALVTSPAKIPMLIIGFFIVQQIENHIISPFVSSAALEIHPAAVILSLYLGSFGGFWGMLLAVPLFCCAKKIIQRLFQSLI